MREPLADDLLGILEVEGATLREIRWWPDGTPQAVMASIPGRLLVEVRDWAPASAVGEGGPSGPVPPRSPGPVFSTPTPTPTPTATPPSTFPKKQETRMSKPIKDPTKADVASAIARLLIDHAHEAIESVSEVEVDGNIVSFRTPKVRFALTVSIPRVTS